MHEQFWQLERGGKFVTVRLEHDPVAGYVDIRAAGLRANVRTTDHADGTTSFDFNVLGEPISILLRRVNGRPIYIFHDPQSATQPVAAPVARPPPVTTGAPVLRSSGSTGGVRAPSGSSSAISTTKGAGSSASRGPRSSGPGYIADPDSAGASDLAPYGAPTTYGAVPEQAPSHGMTVAHYQLPPGLGSSVAHPPVTLPAAGVPPGSETTWPPNGRPDMGQPGPPEFSQSPPLPGFEQGVADKGYDAQNVWVDAPERPQRAAAVSTNVVVMLTAIAALVMFGVGISYLSKNVKSLAVVNWKTFSPAMGGYAIDFPGPVAETAESIKTSGGYMKLHSAEATRLIQGQRVTFTVTYGDLPETSTISTDAALTGARKAVVDQTKGTVLSSSDATLSGFPGNEFSVSSSDGLRHQRVYMVNRRLYELVTSFDGDGTAKTTPKGFEPPDDHFFRTFMLVDDDHPAPAPAAPAEADPAPTPAKTPATPGKTTAAAAQR